MSTMPARVLFVDDDTDLLQLFCDQIRRENYAISTASNGYTAMDIIQREDIQLVITDFEMTKGDGISLANYCSDRHIPCIVLTGHLVEDVRPYIPPCYPVVNKLQLLSRHNLVLWIEETLARAQGDSHHFVAI